MRTLFWLVKYIWLRVIDLVQFNLALLRSLIPHSVVSLFPLTILRIVVCTATLLSFHSPPLVTNGRASVRVPPFAVTVY